MRDLPALVDALLPIVGARRRSDHEGLRCRLHGAAQGRQFAADPGGPGIAADHHRGAETADPGHSNPVRGIGAGARGANAGGGANCGWSIRSTARANSSSATGNSPSTSRWSASTSPCSGWCPRPRRGCCIGARRARGLQPSRGREPAADSGRTARRPDCAWSAAARTRARRRPPTSRASGLT